MRRCCIRYTQWILRFAGIYTNHSPREKSKTGKKSVRSISRPTCYIYQILPPSSDLSLNHALRCSSRSFSMSPSILSTTMKWNRKLRWTVLLEGIRENSHKIACPSHKIASGRKRILPPRLGTRKKSADDFHQSRYTRDITLARGQPTCPLTPIQHARAPPRSGLHPSSIGRGIDILIHFPARTAARRRLF